MLAWQAHRVFVAMGYGFPVELTVQGSPVRGRILSVDLEHPLPSEPDKPGSNIRLHVEGQRAPIPLVLVSRLERAGA